MKKEKGFSFIEVVISVFILLIGILAAISLLSKSMANLIDSRNQIIASQLAQEAIELVTNKRDNNFASGALSGFTTFPGVGTTASQCCYIINYTDPTTITGPIASDSSAKLNYNGSFYTHSAATSTIFNRKMSFDYDLASPTQLDVIVYVWWTNNGVFPGTSSCTTAQKCIFAKDTLTDWVQ